jgi:hypothetical protein
MHPSQSFAGCLGCNTGLGNPHGLTGQVRQGSNTGNDSATRALSNEPKNVQNGQELTEISSKQSKGSFLSISQSFLGRFGRSWAHFYG